MQHYLPLVLLLLCSNAAIYAQNHWETLVFAHDTWHYTIATATTPSNWANPNFDDNAWDIGVGGLGYGDDDDASLLPTGTISAYMRHHFEVDNTAILGQAVLNMDYDDGFVAYLNGIEIARANMDGNPPLYSDLAADHEANVYQGGNYDYFPIDPTVWQSAIMQGDNVLAIEIHNSDPSSSDLSAIPFLSVQVNSPTTLYDLPPTWFNMAGGGFNFSSNLPIVHIYTNGQIIMDEPRIVANMGIIWNGAGNINQLSDEFNHYNGKITVEYRGNSSQQFPKLSMGLTTINADETDLNVSLLNMPAEHDWILYAPYTDKTMMRDVLIHELARNMGWYAPRTQFVELVVDEQYQGIYVLMEKIKRDSNRIDISRLDSDDNSGDELTGGYILKTDHFAGNTGEPFYTPNGITVQYHYPDFDVISSEQQAYIQQYIADFENALFAESFADPNTGYRSYTNIYSFIDAILLNELANNVDGYRLSAYYYKDKDSNCGKLTFSPLWDFNLSLANADYCNGWRTDVWQLYDGCADGPGIWFRRMMQDPYFAATLRCRWFELRQGVLSANVLHTLIDNQVDLLSEAAVRDSTRWQTIGNYIWPNYYLPNTYKGEIDTLQWWLQNRLLWMDQNMFAPSTSCNATATETVRISEINYHNSPLANTNDWVELYNYGTNTIDLSNWQLIDKHRLNRYCTIAPNTPIAPNDYIILSADTAQFISQHPLLSNKVRPLCFNLDNGGTTLALYNAQHQPAFAFTYTDIAPDTLPDGHGHTLELINANAPNNPYSWRASCNVGGTPAAAFQNGLNVWLTTPNDIVCREQMNSYEAPIIAGATYTWTISAGNGVIVSGQGTPQVGIVWLSNGTGEVTVTVSKP
jgi:hypothetical protein